VDPASDLFIKVQRASSDLAATPPPYLPEALCAAIATARAAVGDLQAAPGGNRLLGHTGAAICLDLADAALRRVWPTSWWASRRAYWDATHPGSAPIQTLTAAVAALLDEARAALASGTVDKTADAANEPIANPLAVAEALVGIDGARAALDDELSGHDDGGA
jgi:hypothetical protein